ncbi:MAG: hypothetical protein ACRCTI_19525, partial [Beijerinckiaceae bacterium]
MRSAFLIAASLILAGSALAQQPRPQQRTEPSRQAPPAEPQRRVPDPKHQSRVDQLFERLASTGGEAEAVAVAEQIARIWSRTGSDTLDLLMERVQSSMTANDGVTALDLLDSILALKPDFAEAY